MLLIQRLGMNTQMREDYIDSLLDTVRSAPGSCDEFWFTTCYGYPPLSVQRETAVTLAAMAKKVRAAGIGVSMQVANSIGHGEYIAARDCTGLVYDGSAVGNLVGPDGTVARYCFCWRDPYFRSYLQESVRLYVEAIAPDTVWMDDDLRPNNHDPVNYGCFCPRCIAAFNQTAGTSYDRAGLVEALNDDASDVREKYVSFLRDSMQDFVRMLARTVHAACPTARMGYQYFCNGSYSGYGYSFILDAMREETGKVPYTRPGGGAYWDSNPEVFIEKAEQIDWQNFMLPDYVSETVPEVENLPDVVYGKSIAGTCFETTHNFAHGNTSSSYAMLMNENEPMGWHAQMFAAFAAHRPYWERLAAANVGTRQSGLQIAISRENFRTTPSDPSGVFPWSEEPYDVLWRLRKLAIPFAFADTEDGVYILHPRNAERLSAREVQKLMSRPVVTDGESIAILERRGFFFGVHSMLFHHQRYQEELTDHPLNEGMPRNGWSNTLFSKEGAYFTGLSEKTEILARYNSTVSGVDAEPIGAPATVITPTAGGARWAVFGHSLWSQTPSFARRGQILRAADYISGNRLRAILQTPLQASVLPREDGQGNLTSVSVVNMTIGESGELTLRLRHPIGEKFVFCSATCMNVPLSFTRDREDYIVHLPSFPAWSVGTVFCE